MSCKICGRGSCASWMHSAEQQEAWSLVESMDDRQLKSEVVDLRGEVAALKAEIADEAIALRDMMSERDAAEAELAGIRALADRRNERDHSQDTTHQLVAALDQSLDIVQAELAEQRWLKGCAIKRSQELLSELAAERARLDYLSTRGFEHRHHETGDHLGYEWTISSYSESKDVTLREVIDAEMREDAK